MRRCRSLSASSTRCIRRSAGSRSRRSGCCGPCCCRRSTRSARSGSWSSGSTTTCCSAGLSGSASMIRCGTPRPSPRTATGCWRAMWRCKFLAAVLAQPRSSALLSSEHFSVDGTLLEAWASPKSFRPKDGSGEPPGAGAQRRAGLPWREAQQRHPRLDHRPRCPALPQRAGQGSEAVLHGPRADGEPQRPDRRRGRPPAPRAMPSGWRRCA